MFASPVPVVTPLGSAIARGMAWVGVVNCIGPTPKDCWEAPPKACACCCSWLTRAGDMLAGMSDTSPSPPASLEAGLCPWVIDVVTHMGVVGPLRREGSPAVKYVPLPGVEPGREGRGVRDVSGLYCQYYRGQE